MKALLLMTKEEYMSSGAFKSKLTHNERIWRDVYNKVKGLSGEFVTIGPVSAGDSSYMDEYKSKDINEFKDGESVGIIIDIEDGDNNIVLFNDYYSMRGKDINVNVDYFIHEYLIKKTYTHCMCIANKEIFNYKHRLVHPSLNETTNIDSMEFDTVEMSILKQMYLGDKVISNKSISDKLSANSTQLRKYTKEELREIKDCLIRVHSSLGSSIEILKSM